MQDNHITTTNNRITSMANVGLMCLVSAVILVPTYVSSAGGELPVNVTIYPHHLHFMANSAPSKITCKASQPISIICEFRLFDLTFMNLNQVPYLKYELMNANECAVTLGSSHLNMDSYYMVTCRVRTSNTDWVYASMSVFKSNKWGISLENTAYDLVVLPGRQQKVAVRGLTKLSACRTKNLRSTEWKYLFHTSNWICIEGQDFYGRGQGKCEQTCGVTFDNTTEADNGILLLDGESTYYRDITFISIIIAKLPNNLTLTHEIVENDKGSRLTATCTVSGGRPAPRLVWSIDGDLAPDEAVRSATSDTWVWPFEEQTLRQSLTIDLKASHAGKEVECAATHTAYNITIYNSFKIRKDSPVATMMPAPSLPASSTSEMSSDDVTVTTSSSAVTQTTNQGTGGVTTPDSVGVSEELGCELKCEVAERNVTWFYVIIGVLVLLLVVTIILGVLYARRKALFRFSGPTDSVPVKYRRSLDATLRYEETRSPTVSSIDRSSAVTGLEYAEIRVSMVQRCVDKLVANTGTLSAETGEMSEATSRPNSLYLAYDEKV